MMRRKKHTHEEHSNHERWLVSYADFITLMFAFFVVMFASSQADKAKVTALSEAVQQALATDIVSEKIRAMISGAPPKTEIPRANTEQKMAELSSPLEELKKALHDDIQRGRLAVTMEARGLVISLKQATFFPTGDATISPAGYEAIDKVSRTLLKIPNPVRLEGHTDSIPISNGRFSSNWELSAARSISMLDLFTKRYGMPAGRLAVVGYADTVPIDTNDTDEGRARNRRVDITVLNDLSVRTEPTGKPAH